MSRKVEFSGLKARCLKWDSGFPHLDWSIDFLTFYWIHINWVWFLGSRDESVYSCSSGEHRAHGTRCGLCLRCHLQEFSNLFQQKAVCLLWGSERSWSYSEILCCLFQVNECFGDQGIICNSIKVLLFSSFWIHHQSFHQYFPWSLPLL